MNLYDIMMKQPDPEDDDPEPLHEAQVDELQAILRRYRSRPFKVGDLVTPRPEGPVRDAGRPHIVLEAGIDEQVDPAIKADLRLGYWDGHGYRICLGESLWYEPWPTPKRS